MNSEQNNAEGLKVKSVLDKRRPEGFQLLDAEVWLNSLTEVGYTELRSDSTQQKNDVPMIVCAECEWPVYSPDVGGKRRFFQHRKGFPRTCCYSGEGKDPRQVDANKFGGIQEGQRHKDLKEILCEVLSFSETARNISQERHVSLVDRTFARPDVYAEDWLGGPIAFDIQLATTQIPTIDRREAFYKRGGIRYVWITAVNQQRLPRRAFRDIYMKNDGQIFGIDEEVLKEARKQKIPLFRIYRLVPGPAEKGFEPRFKNKIVSEKEIDWGGPGSRPRSRSRSYDELVAWRGEKDPFICENRLKFFSALAEGDGEVAGRIWDLVQTYVGGMSWSQIPADSWDTGKALGVLATLATGKLCIETRIDKDNEAHLVNSLLLEPKGRWLFGELLKQLLQATGRYSLLSKLSVSEKLERAIAETMNIALAKNIGPVYDAFIPQGAFCRLMLESTNGFAPSGA